jgi:hypothetical protein
MNGHNFIQTFENDALKGGVLPVAEARQARALVLVLVLIILVLNGTGSGYV